MTHILYVDDESALLEMAQVYLGNEGEFTIDTAPSAKMGLEMVRTHSYEAIVSDFQMPDMDGIGFLREVRRMNPEIPFLIFTGKGREEIAIQAINQGADFYVQKGGDVEAQFRDLGHKIMQSVRRRRAEEELRLSEQRFKTLFEKSAEAQVLVDGNGMVIDCNAAFLQLFSVEEKSDIIGTSAFERSPDCQPDGARSRERVKAVIDDVMKNGTATAEWVRFTSGPAAIPVTCDLILTRVPDASGTVIHLAVRDITDRKRAETALKESEVKFRTLLEHIPDLVLVQRDGKVIYVNSSTIKTMRHIPEEVIGRPITDFVVPEYLGTVYDTIRKRQAGNPAEPYEIEVMTADGLHRTVIVRGALIDYGGAPAILNVMTDITEQKQFEKILRESEAKYLDLIERAYDGICVVQDGAVRLCNPKVAELWGGTTAEIVGRNFTDFIDQASISEVLDRYALRMKGDPAPGVYDVILSRKDGTPFAAEINAGVSFYEGRPADFIIIRDTTESRRMEILHSETEERFRALSDLLPVLYFEFDAGGNTVFANHFAEELFGYTREEVVQGVGLADIIHPSDLVRASEHVRSVYANERVEGTEYTFLRKDGSSFTLIVYVTAIPGGPGKGPTGFRGVGIDNSERKRASEALLLANRKLNLLSSVTRHDVLNKLTILQGYLKLLDMRLSDTGQKEYLVKGLNAVEAIERQIAFTRAYEELGVAAPAWQPVNGTIAAAVNALGKSPYETLIAVDPSLQGLSIYADPLLRNVFFNLFENAVYYAGRPDPEIGVSAREESGTLIITVSDSGAGVPAAEKELIFVRGYGKRTGFGLFLAREILSITGLTIRENGTPGQGARFEIVVPQGSYRFEGRTGL